jgi:hypothetical protein
LPRGGGRFGGESPATTRAGILVNNTTALRINVERWETRSS